MELPDMITPNNIHQALAQVRATLSTKEKFKPDTDISAVQNLLDEIDKVLSEQHSLLDAVFNNAPYISIIVDSEGRVQNINRTGVTFSGKEKSELLNSLGGEVFNCLNSFHGSGCGLNEECSSCPIRTKVNYTLETKQSIYSAEGNMTFVRQNQQISMDILVSTTPILFISQEMVLVTIVDISEQKQLESKLSENNKNLQAQLEEIESLQEKLREQVIRDPLTNLHNRRYLEDKLKGEINRAQVEGGSVSVIIMDIDHFKNINDTYGHVAGDELLIEISRLIKANIRRKDIACRYGGDEFVIILPETDTHTAQKRANLLHKNIVDLVLKVNTHWIKSTPSLGISTFPEHGANSQEVLFHADQSLYHAKQNGRNQVCLYQNAS